MSDVDLFGDPISVDFKLRQKYIEPPFSVLDTKGGSWQSRKRQWKSIGIKSELGRDGGLSYNTQSWIEEKSESKFLDGTSIFDPVLCELMYLWFCPDGGKILDPFAGGSVRGIVANLRGYDYTGIELQQNQVDSNREQASDVLEINNQPQWYVGDSEKILEDFIDPLPSDGKIKISVNDLSKHPGRRNGELFDFVFSCPPYHNLEVYSDSPDDLSNMGYNEFLIKYRNIIDKTVQRLKIGCYACFVVSEIRKKDGTYRGFVKDTIQAFEDTGCGFYNDVVLLNSLGSAPVRAGKQMEKSKKVVKVHQNVLVFKKNGCERLS